MKKAKKLSELMSRTERARFAQQLRSLAVARVLTDDEIAKAAGGGHGLLNDPHGVFGSD